MSFKENFVWGAAAASYQVEGAAREDGKGLSVWDMFCRQPGKIRDGHTGDVACDHYHRYKEDVGLMKETGLKAYRFSISWPRVLPEGTGRINEKGIGFYDRLVDELLAAGIDPWVTLFHWDYPYALFLRGGWLNPDSPKWFADYTRVIVDRLSDRVSNWITLNEPQCFVALGHGGGEQAPGLKLGLEEMLLVNHHALIAHGLAVQTIRTYAQKSPHIGWAPVGLVSYPSTGSAEDIEAARRAMFEMNSPGFWNNSWFADPPLLGKYPEDGLRIYGKAAPAFTSTDMEIISQPIDFYGVNIYYGQEVKAGPDGNPVVVFPPAGGPRTHNQWTVSPESLYWGPRFLYERYKKPIVVTENGLAAHDWVAADGRVHDYHRIDFLRQYLTAYRRAAADGVDARGYFSWTIMDNFEWQEGYAYRFGLIHVDFKTQKRTPKDSAGWYRNVIRSNGASLDCGDFQL